MEKAILFQFLIGTLKTGKPKLTARPSARVSIPDRYSKNASPDAQG